MARSKENAAYGVSDFFVNFANVGGAGGCGHDPILGDVEFIDSIGKGNAGDDRDDFVGVVSTVSSH